MYGNHLNPFYFLLKDPLVRFREREKGEKRLLFLKERYDPKNFKLMYNTLVSTSVVSTVTCSNESFRMSGRIRIPNGF